MTDIKTYTVKSISTQLGGLPSRDSLRRRRQGWRREIRKEIGGGSPESGARGDADVGAGRPRLTRCFAGSAVAALPIRAPPPRPLKKASRTWHSRLPLLALGLWSLEDRTSCRACKVDCFIATIPHDRLVRR